jgi:hypothetical protein
MLALELAVGLLFGLRLFQRNDLACSISSFAAGAKHRPSSTWVISS